jgi:hypothetical protein
LRYLLGGKRSGTPYRTSRMREIVDNLPAHKRAEVRQIIEAAGAA